MITSANRRLSIVAIALALGATGFWPSRTFSAAPAPPIPERLTDAEFWTIIRDFSEPNGFFRSENLVSNEHTFQYVIPALKQVVKPGGVYMGVAPDQNFTYILAVQPKIAFIVDIRRGNLLELLMYKAVIELSADRADFISRLFSKKRPPGLTPRSTVTQLFAAYDSVSTSPALYADNIAAVKTHLQRKHGFALSPDDLRQLESIYFAFFWDGPGIRYSTTPSGFGGGRGFGNINFPTYEDLMTMTDTQGHSRSYLASEESFRTLKALEERNLIVPIVGNFAGSKAIRAVGRYVRDHGAVVSAFYVSNVEQYLFQDGIWTDFARNVETLPLDESSMFIRSVSSRNGYEGPFVWYDGRASALDPMRAFVRDFEGGRIKNYYDVNARSK